jgi:hypothetical protein
MNKVIAEAIAERLILVDQRIAAIKTELDMLEVERPLLCGLLVHWRDTDYDSIEEERRVTSEMLNLNLKKVLPIEQPPVHAPVEKTKVSTSTVYRGKISDIILELLYDAPYGLKTSEIATKISHRIGREVATNTMWYNLNKLSNLEGDDKIVKVNGKWVLQEYVPKTEE